MPKEITPGHLQMAKVTLLTDWQAQLEDGVAPLLGKGYKVARFNGMDEWGCEAEFPDVFITDLQQSAQDPFAVVRQIRNMSARVGILMVISSRDRDHGIKAFLSGADNYILRPYEVEELFAVVKNLARRVLTTQKLNRPGFC